MDQKGAEGRDGLFLEKCGILERRGDEGGILSTLMSIWKEAGKEKRPGSLGRFCVRAAPCARATPGVKESGPGGGGWL